MFKPKAKRPSDSNRLAKSVVGDAINLTGKPAKFPKLRRKPKRASN